MNENIKTFCLSVITICVFVMTLLNLLETIDRKKDGGLMNSGYNNAVSGNQETTGNNEIKPSVPLGPPTSINFRTTEHDFGTITEGEKVTHRFTFINSGDAPLIISNASASCGCTVPSYPKEPIAPGASAEIEVVFDSQGKPGLQEKTVTVTANTNPPETTLKIRSNVQTKS